MDIKNYIKSFINSNDKDKYSLLAKNLDNDYLDKLLHIDEFNKYFKNIDNVKTMAYHIAKENKDISLMLKFIESFQPKTFENMIIHDILQKLYLEGNIKTAVKITKVTDIGLSISDIDNIIKELYNRYIENDYDNRFLQNIHDIVELKKNRDLFKYNVYDSVNSDLNPEIYDLNSIKIEFDNNLKEFDNIILFEPDNIDKMRELVSENVKLYDIIKDNDKDNEYKDKLKKQIKECNSFILDSRIRDIELNSLDF